MKSLLAFSLVLLGTGPTNLVYANVETPAVCRRLVEKAGTIDDLLNGLATVGLSQEEYVQALAIVGTQRKHLEASELRRALRASRKQLETEYRNSGCQRE